MKPVKYRPLPSVFDIFPLHQKTKLSQGNLIEKEDPKTTGSLFNKMKNYALF